MQTVYIDKGDKIMASKYDELKGELIAIKNALEGNGAIGMFQRVERIEKCLTTMETKNIERDKKDLVFKIIFTVIMGLTLGTNNALLKGLISLIG